MQALPHIDDTWTFSDWTFVAEGTHAIVYRAKETEFGEYYCMKLFRSGWMTPFNLEKTAYELLQDANIVGYIPHVYGYGYRTLSDWGIPSSEDDIYYGFVMEWLGKAEKVSAENITLDSAAMLLEGLADIHRAGVLHNDMYRRNIMVIPGEERGVWIDFSCAHTDEENMHRQEMNICGGIVLGLVALF